MMSLQLKVVVFLAFVVVIASGCKYAKFSSQHTYCKPPNSRCEILDKGVSDEDKKTIVKIHNQYREKVASGKESKAGGLPSAANMMEVMWDDELAKIAQKHVEQCKFDHDCKDCRKVERFDVGQNLHTSSSSNKPSKTDWAGAFKAFYDEVSLFNKKNIKPFVFGNGYGHFTQMVWSKVWRVGCGRVLYKDGKWYKTLLTCNYGPSGNMEKAEMYKAGSPCSSCPSGSSCGSYKGLCKVKDPNSFSI